MEWHYESQSGVSVFLVILFHGYDSDYVSLFVENRRTAGARVDGSIDLDKFPHKRTSIKQEIYSADLTFDI